ncbi:hypothetical protein FXO38_25585 [Capsicum annuum]|nr:hypothetical protein FXO38_25585 [Capsicum annuum]KAF3657952.1 hypothetical protein FXO37_14644 [Capsicum annuum]
MPNVLNVWMYEYCSEVDNTIAECVGNVIQRIFNWKVVGIKVKYEKFMGGMFSKFVYNNLRPTREEVQRLDLTMIEGIELNDADSAFSHDTSINRSGKRHFVDIHTHSNTDHQGFNDFSTVLPPKILRKTVRKHYRLFQEKICQQTRTSDSGRVDAPNRPLSSSSKSAYQAIFDEKWDEIKSFLQSYFSDYSNLGSGAQSQQLMWKKSRGENAVPMSWQVFQDVFLDKFFLDKMRKDKMEEFINLRQGSVLVKEYCFKFNQLSKYAPNQMVDSRSSMSKFVTDVFGLVVKECRTTMLIGDIDLASLKIHAQ